MLLIVDTLEEIFIYLFFKVTCSLLWMCLEKEIDLDFEQTVRQSALDLKLQPEEGFILKVTH